MRKCAYCGRENERDVNACAECGTELAPPGPPSLAEQEFTQDGKIRRVVARLSRVRQAEFLCQALTDGGIEAAILDRSERGFLGFVNPVGRILVHVSGEQAASAAAVISRIMPSLAVGTPAPPLAASDNPGRIHASEAAGAPVPDNMRVCSYCGQTNPLDACSLCRTEFTPAELPPDRELIDPANNLVTVARCRTVVEANLLKLHLERAGIEACVPEELTPQIFWSVVPSPLEEVTVRVKSRDEAAARQALAEGPGPESPPPLPS